MPRNVLILGGTRDARELAALLIDGGFEVTSSLAGFTAEPELPRGKVRSGGFGGAAGLQRFLVTEGIDILIDATHPFAAQMSRHGVEAAAMAGIPLLRLERPPWRPDAGDNWLAAYNMDEACQLLPAGARVLLTTGRKHIEPFVRRVDLSGVIRAIEPPATALRGNWMLRLARPPFSLADEKELMAREGITHIVAKNAGGSDMRAKLNAARELALPVIMVERPRKPTAEIYATAQEICKALGRRLGP
jgi:precorrin-6A/cobalt-precorrin-6A reductase